MAYDFSRQEKDFIKMQFLYGLQLQNRLAAGTITQDYYDSHFWLTTQTLESPDAAWWGEFKTAIQQTDFNWVANAIGESVQSVQSYVGNVIGQAAAGATQGMVTGLTQGFFGSLNVVGWLTLAGAGIAIYYGFKSGLIQKAFNITTKAVTTAL